MAEAPPSTQRKHLVPLLVLLCVALALAYVFRDALSYEALSENRLRLIALLTEHCSEAYATMIEERTNVRR